MKKYKLPHFILIELLDCFEIIAHFGLFSSFVVIKSHVVIPWSCLSLMCVQYVIVGYQNTRDPPSHDENHRGSGITVSHQCWAELFELFDYSNS